MGSNIDPILQSDGSLPATLLYHLKQFSTELFFVRDDQIDATISLGFMRPYLLNTLLAVSACHLRHLSSSPSRYRVAEHCRQLLAISEFRGALEKPLDHHSADALVLTSMFLNMLSFASVDRIDPLASWVFNKSPDTMNWFSLGLGLKPLLLATRDFREDAIVRWACDASTNVEYTSSSDALSLDSVPSSWLALCGLEQHHTDPANVFSEPLRLLASLKTLEPKREHFFMYLDFFGTLDVGFRRLLEEEEETAMWILGMWFGLLCRYDIWFFRAKVRTDYYAINLWLEHRGVTRRPGRDGEMWTGLMADIAAICNW